MIYVDKFGGGNSNDYWLESFRKIIPSIISIDIRKHSAQYILERILEIKPKHIHFGGSVKMERIFPSVYIKELKDRLKNVKITFFYGDGYYFPYQRNIIPYIDKLIITHKPCDIISDKVGFSPCPTILDPPKINRKKIYEVSFIGNNYSKDRLEDLNKISEICDLTVFGKNWESTELKSKKSVSFEQFPEVVSQSKFCLGSTLFNPCLWSGSNSCAKEIKIVEDRLCHDIHCVDYKEMYGYFSNRIMNLCACRASVLLLQTKGLDKIFTDMDNILFFKDLKHFKNLINEYKNRDNELKKIGESAYSLSRNYTFDKLVELLLL